MVISVIIPVYNEKDLIEENLILLKKTSKQSNIEIIVVDGNSHDTSFQLAQKHADKVLACPYKGRAMQMHMGALAAKGNLLLFLHIDTILPDDWINCLLCAWENKLSAQKATAFNLNFDRTDWPYNLILCAAKYRYFITGVPHGDQAIAIQRDTYFKYGGFPDVPLMEEYALLNRIKDNNQITLLPKNVKTSTRRYRKGYPLIYALRNTILVFLYYFGISPHTLAKFYH